MRVSHVFSPKTRRTAVGSDSEAGDAEKGVALVERALSGEYGHGDEVVEVHDLSPSVADVEVDEDALEDEVEDEGVADELESEGRDGEERRVGHREVEGERVGRLQDLLEAEGVEEDGDGDGAGVEEQQRRAPLPHVFVGEFAEEVEVVKPKAHDVLAVEVEVADELRAEVVEGRILLRAVLAPLSDVGRREARRRKERPQQRER
mmetsp:Transcript_11559/g.38003  ORF Transcript_11559/g.38003 Transcript_11559/m.38003 type:complete len:205 (+) Transcript_11559:193-807(+)